MANKKVLLWSLVGVLAGSVALVAMIDENANRFGADETPSKQCVSILFGTEQYTGSNLIALNDATNSYYTLNSDSNPSFGISAVSKAYTYRPSNVSSAVRLSSGGNAGNLSFTFNGSYYVSAVKITAYAYDANGKATFKLSNNQSVAISTSTTAVPTLADDADAASAYIFTLSNSGATASTGFSFTGIGGSRLNICKIVLTLNGGTPSSSSSSSAASSTSSASSASSSSASSSTSSSVSSSSSSVSSSSSSSSTPVSTGDYRLVSSTSDLIVGDSYVFACNTKGVTAITISDSVMGSVASTFSTDRSTVSSLGKDTVEMVLGGSAGAYTFTYDGQLLGCTAVKLLAWGSGTTTWTIELSSSNALVTSTAGGFGKIQYNSGSPRFTTYTTTGQNAIQLYHKSSTPVYATSIALNYATLNLGINETQSLVISYTPANTNQKNVSWTSTSPTIATVSSSGLVSGIAAGNATITATVATDGTPVTASCAVTVKTISVTGVAISRSSLELGISKTSTLTSTISPSNATNKNVSWSTSASSIATVSSSGIVTGVAVGSATIKVTTADGGYQASCLVSITATPQSAWTIMFYMCGADLESNSQNRLATADLTEIKSVTGQPDDVNIIFEAGGASSWASTYSSVISASYLNRFHLSNGSYVKDAQITKANMGLTSTFQNFLEWGLNTYPAERTMVVMWDHGGAMRGCCYDENYSDDSLLNSEVKSALTGAFASTGRSSKLEAIGYDACLMQVQDIAEFDSSYFNYMVASQESESGYGWDYDGGWLTSIYDNPSTVTTSAILTSVVDTFVADNGGVSSTSNDQTLSWLDLNNMGTYKTAWENMASYLNSSVLTSSNETAFQTLVKSCKTYAVDKNNSQYYFAVIDVSDFLTKLLASSTFNKLSVPTYVSAVQTAFNNLVKYSSCGAAAGNSHGLCMFFSVDSYSEQTSVYVAAETNFTNWITTNRNFGV